MDDSSLPLDVTPAPVSRPPKVSPLRRSPARKMTRAHLSVLQRPQLAERMQALLTKVTARLSELLGTPLTITARLAPSAVIPLSGLSRFSSFALFELAPFAQPAVLEIERRTLGTVIRHISGEVNSPGPLLSLTKVEEAAFGWLLLESTALLRADEVLIRYFGPRLLSLHDSTSPVLDLTDGRVRHLAIELDLQLGDTRGSARLLLPGRCVQAALQELEKEPAPLMHPAFAYAQIRATALGGTSQLSAQDANLLRKGDVVLLDHLAKTERGFEGDVRLLTHGFELHGRLSDGAFTLARVITHALSKEKPMKTEEEQTQVLPSLPVQIEVELTRLNLKLGELATLRPGSVIPLRISPVDPVLLRVGDRVVAKAELVEIDGELGARILGLGG